MEIQSPILPFHPEFSFQKLCFEMFQRGFHNGGIIAAIDADLADDDTNLADDDYVEEDFEPQVETSRRRTKKRKIYCFNCNRQEFHIMAYKGTLIHSFLMGMSFGLARIFGPYRCTCCGKKRAMYADFCSLSYHWRMMSERRLSKSSRRRSRRRR